MPKVSPEHEKHRRQEILQAALKCFARHGYHRTTMDDIVQQAGLSKGAIYQYFRTKEELFLALRRLRQAEVRHGLEGVFAVGASVRERLERGAKVFLTSLQARDRAVCRIGVEFWAEALRRPHLRNSFRNDYTTWLTFLARLIAEGVRTMEFRSDVSPEALAAVILALCDGLTLHWASFGNIVDPEEVLMALFSGLFLGISGKRAPRRKRG